MTVRIKGKAKTNPTDSSFVRLLEYACDKIQGYLVAKPLDEEAAIRLLETE